MYSKGSKSGASTKCAGCQGTGMKVTIRQLGPAMIQQMQHACNECKGTGETINDRDRCPQCKGEKVVPEKKVLEVVVEKGMNHGQKITFPGEADEAVSSQCVSNFLWFSSGRSRTQFILNSLFTLCCVARHSFRRYCICPATKRASQV